MGRIEHTLLDGGRASTPTDLRPPPALTPYHKKATNVSSHPKAGALLIARTLALLLVDWTYALRLLRSSGLPHAGQWVTCSA